MTTRDVQAALARAGFDPGPIDGQTGPKTIAAVKAFQRQHGLKADGIVGPLTRQKLFPTIVAERAGPATNAMPAWLRNAVAEIGQKEVAGRGSNARIIAYRKLGKTTDDAAAEDGSRPWCADFVNAMLETAGVRGTRSGMARSFEGSKHFIKLAGPALGAIVTQWRGSKSAGTGHVYFYGGRYPDGRIAAIGGNQNDAATVAPYGTARVVGYYWPAGQPLPATGHVPTIMQPTGAAGREV